MEIANIDISGPRDNEVDLLTINEEISAAAQSELREIIRVGYIEAERPVVPKIKGEMKLLLRDHEPFHFPARRLSFAEKRDVREILDRLLSKRVIKESVSEYASPIVLVKRKKTASYGCA